MPRGLSRPLPAPAALALAALLLAAAPLRGDAAPGKVDPWVLRRTEGSAQAELLVVLGERADLSGAAALPTKLEKGLFVRERLLAVATRSQRSLLAELRRRGVPHRPFYVVNAVWVRGDRSLVTALAKRPDVARVEGNPSVRAVVEPPRPAPARPAGPTAVEAGVAATRAPEVWALGFTGQGVVVGGMDTGVQWDHPALMQHYRGWNGTSADHRYSWHDAVHSGGGACGADSPVPCDDGFHGTHTMGTAVGDDGGSNQIGMAPGARWIACRNMDQGAGTPATYLECFEFFLAPYPVGGSPAEGDPALAPDVTNNSWGCPPSEGCSTVTLDAALEAHRAAGILTVASAGNSGPSCALITDPPAISPAALTVGALVTGTDSVASFSSLGPVTADGSGRPKPDLVAPGTSTRSAAPVDAYALVSGTSMAGPHAAGAAALLLSARPELSGRPDDVADVLRRSAAGIPASACASPALVPNHLAGHGRLDARAAVGLPPSTRFRTLAPCRLLDTRSAAGPLGGPALSSGAGRSFAVSGKCGVPATAACLAVNLTAVGAAGAGFLKAFPSGRAEPPTSALNFAAGATRANNAVLCLGAGTAFTLLPSVQGGGAVDALVDVSGWFE